MKPPVILDNRGDLLVFENSGEALAYAEAVDVEDGEYEAFDSEGRMLTLGTTPGGRYGRKRVVILDAEEQPLHQEELRVKLLSFLRRAGTPPDPSASLDALISALQAWRHNPRK